MPGKRVVEGEFKGYPTITIYTGREFNGKEEFITMGVQKAVAVDDNIDAIRAFVDRYTDKKKSDSGYPGGKPPDDDIPF